jgi:hypothetical protein
MVPSAARSFNQMIVHPMVLVSSSGILFMPVPSGLIEAMDDAIRDDLQNFSDFFFWLAMVSSAVVVIGVVIEGPELLNELWPKTFSLFAKRWVKKIGLIGWLLVVIGVGGEVVFGLLENKAQGLLQTFDEILLADAQRQSGAANERANGAYERAAETESEASQENERAAKAEQHAAEENSRAAKALEASEIARKDAEGFQLKIALANERAANAELETEQLRKQLADRTLSPAQEQSIGKKLKQFSGQPYTITAYWDSKESMGLANQIHTALKLIAGWSYSDEGSKSMMLGGEVGVMVWTHPDADESTKHAKQALIDALNAEGIETESREQNPKNPKTNMIAINVGAKR